LILKGIDMEELFCDKCGDEIEHDTPWGNCEECGEQLCEYCSPDWTADGVCYDCSHKGEFLENTDEQLEGTDDIIA
jgi:hypothetical protein